MKFEWLTSYQLALCTSLFSLSLRAQARVFIVTLFYRLPTVLFMLQSLFSTSVEYSLTYSLTQLSTHSVIIVWMNYRWISVQYRFALVYRFSRFIAKNPFLVSTSPGGIPLCLSHRMNPFVRTNLSKLALCKILSLLQLVG